MTGGGEKARAIYVALAEGGSRCDRGESGSLPVVMANATSHWVAGRPFVEPSRCDGVVVGECHFSFIERDPSA